MPSAEGFEILTEPAKFEPVHKQIEAKGIKCASAEVTLLPLATVPVNSEGGAEVSRLIGVLEERDNVTEVYSNAEFAE